MAFHLSQDQELFSLRFPLVSHDASVNVAIERRDHCSQQFPSGVRTIKRRRILDNAIKVLPMSSEEDNAYTLIALSGCNLHFRNGLCRTIASRCRQYGVHRWDNREAKSMFLMR